MQLVSIFELDFCGRVRRREQQTILRTEDGKDWYFNKRALQLDNFSR